MFDNCSQIDDRGDISLLAIRLEGMVRSGEVPDQAALARLGMVTRARMTQIMNLLNLAPNIQEHLLFPPAVAKGREKITERSLRPIVAELDWGVQRRLWQGRCCRTP